MSNPSTPFLNTVMTSEELQHIRNEISNEGHEAVLAVGANREAVFDGEISFGAVGGSFSISHEGSGSYGGCKECTYYSQLFGGSSGGRKLDTEEKFEVAKEEFTIHFNDEHKDLIMKRRELPKKKQEFKKSRPNIMFGQINGEGTMISSVRFTDASIIMGEAYGTPFISTSIPTISNITDNLAVINQQDSHVYDFRRLGRIMDRHERFHAWLRRG